MPLQKEKDVLLLLIIRTLLLGGAKGGVVWESGVVVLEEVAENDPATPRSTS